MADQTNAEVSDERLRELEPCPFCYGEVTHVKSWAKSFKPPILYVEYHHDCAMFPHRVWSFPASSELHSAFVAAWNRRSVTSQASEGEVVVGWRWYHVTQPNEWQYGGPDFRWQTGDPELVVEPLYASPVSKRVERLETALKPFVKCADMLVFSGATTADEIELSGEELFTALMTARQALQGGRS